MKNIAVFDVCGTLYTCNTLFEFVRTLPAAKKHLKIADSLFVKMIDAFFPALQFRNQLYLKSLKNFSQEQLDHLAKEFVLNHLSLKICPLAATLLEAYRGKNYDIILISCSPDFLVRQVAKFFSASDFRAPQYQNGRLITSFYKRKHHYLNDFTPFDHLYVCTDNKSDTVLLQLADQKTIFIAKSKKNYRYFKRLFGDKDLILRK